MLGPKGATAGALLCGTIAGTGASFSQYEIIKKIDNFKPYSIPNRLDNIQPGQAEIVAGYVDVQHDIYDEDFALGISLGIDSIHVGVGVKHNYIIERVETIEVEEIDSIIRGSLTDLERQVLYSEEFQEGYEEIISEPLRSNINYNSFSDQVFNLFIDEIYEDCTSQQDLENIVLYYVEEVKNTSYLSIEEKDWLLSAFSVMVYSFEYWSNEFPYIEN